MHYPQREQRYPIQEEVFDADSGKKIGYTLNMSAFGMLMISKQPFKENETVRMRVTMTLEQEERVTLNLLGECRWTGHIENTPLHKNGFYFNQPGPVYSAYTNTLLNAIP